MDVQSVSKSYPRRAGLRTEMRPVVENVSFTIDPGETLGLVGESGSGKTTLARMVLGLVKPTGGRVLVDGVDVAAASGEELRRLRRQMQPVFQDPYAALNPRMKVLEIVTEPFAIHGRAAGMGGGRGELRKGAVELLRAVGLDESALGAIPTSSPAGSGSELISPVPWLCGRGC